MTIPAAPRPLAWIPVLTPAACLVVAALAGLALLGWAIDSPLLKGLHGAVPMNHFTALCLLLAAVALALLCRPSAAPATRQLGRGLGALVAIIGLYKAAEYLFGLRLGLDLVLLPEQIGAANAIAPNTALCMVLLGAALALADVEDAHSGRPDQILALLGALPALLALLGYAYGMPLYGVPLFVPMALNTALGFALLSAGILASRPDRGLMRLVSSPGPGGTLIRRLLPLAVLLPTLLGAACLAGERAGLFEVEAGLAVFALANAVLSGGGVLLTAAMLDRAEVRRRGAEVSMHHERHLLRQLMDHLPDSIFFKDAQSRFTRINQSLARRLGLTDPAEAVGKTDFDFFTEEHARPAFEDEQHVLETGEVLIGKEEKETWPDGRRRWVLTTRLPLRGPDGRTVGTFGIARDITERKQAEETLRQSEEQQRLLLESTGEGIYGIDTEGRCTFINPAGASLLGYDASELRGRDMHETMHHHKADGSPYPVEECPILQAIRDGHICRAENEVFWRKDGTSFPIDYAAAPIRGGGKAIRGAVVTFTDNSERERMRALLMQSEKLASIGLLSAGIAHEINNPLAYVANNLAVLQRDFKGLVAILDAYEANRSALAATAADAAAHIAVLAEDLDLPYVRQNLDRVLTRTRDGVQRVTNIVQGLRSLARTDRPQMQEAYLPELVEMALELIRERLRRRGVRIEQEYATSLKLHCVPTQIGQVVLNLLTNAMHAIESAGRGNTGRITIRARVVGPEIILEVEDNGGGIDPKDLPQIFDPFFTTKPVGEGTGLGLAITHGIVTGHGGRIDVESEKGKGTRFRLFLPVHPPKNARPSGTQAGGAVAG